jgi:WD40 repeat protein
MQWLDRLTTLVSFLISIMGPVWGNETSERPSPPPIEVTCLAVAPKHAIAAVGCSDGTVRVIDLDSGQTLRVSASVGGSVARLVWSPDERLIATATFEPALEWSELLTSESEYNNALANWHVIEANTGAQVLAFQCMQPNRDDSGCAWRPDSGALVTWGWETFADLRTIAPASVRRRLDPRSGASFACALWSPDGKLIFDGDSRGWLESRDGTTGEILDARETEMTSIRCLRLSRDGSSLFAGGAVHRVGCWSTAGLALKWSQQQVDSGDERQTISSLVLDPTESFLITAVPGWGSVQRWSAASGSAGWFVDCGGGDSSSLHIQLDPPGLHLLSWDLGRADCARMLSTETGAVEHELRLDISDGVGNVAWSADGRYIVIRSYAVSVFDGRDFRRLRTWYPCGIVYEQTKSSPR